jgi:4-amino-4-deoxy-L-arabinose transferase-like glycosyltransferase
MPDPPPPIGDDRNRRDPPPQAAPARGWRARALGALVALDERRLVAGALMAGLLLRLAALALAAATGHVQIRWDEIYVAQNMLAGKGYAFNYYGIFYDPDRLSAFFPPAYVFNVYLLLRVFHSVLAVAIENVLLSVGVSAALYALVRRLFDPLTARLALLMSVIYPPFIARVPHGVNVFPRMLLTVLMVLALQRLWTGRRPVDAVLGGLWAGLLALMMPDALVYVLMFALAARVAPARWRLPWRRVAVVAATTVLVIAPWTLRNWIRFHEFCPISTNGGFMFYMGCHDRATQEVDFDCLTDLDQRLGGELTRADEVQRSAILYREGWRWMLREPTQAALNMLARVGLHWSFRPSNVKDMGLMPGRTAMGGWTFRLYIWSYAISYLLVLVLALPGFLRCHQRWAELTPIWLAFAYSTAVAALFVVQTKMRLVKVDPFLLLFAACYFADRWRARDAARRGTAPV